MQSLSDGSVLKITERYFFTPNKSVINEVGVSPDVEVILTEEDMEEGRDPQLQEAVKIINNM
jgi:carboxyl-terminal processing protease